MILNIIYQQNKDDVEVLQCRALAQNFAFLVLSGSPLPECYHTFYYYLVVGPTLLIHQMFQATDDGWPSLRCSLK